jgi:hypothetical protein
MSESARIGRLLDRQRQIQCAAAIQSAKGCCAAPPAAGTVFIGGTGGVPSTTLTVTSVVSGVIYVGMTFTYGGTLNGIVRFGTGTGGTGTYTINSHTIPDGVPITSINNSLNVPVNQSVIEQEAADPFAWGSLIFPGAVNIRGTLPTTESARIKKLSDHVSSKIGCGYAASGIPFIPPGCPPVPTAIANGNLPKPSTKVPCPPVRFEGNIVPCSQ